MPTSPARLDSLTSLRFFAAGAVVLYHVGVQVEPLAGTDLVFGLGYTGVTFFFVLSGFVLTWTRRDDDTVRSFYWRRFARVWPLHALTAVAAAVLLLSRGEEISAFAAATTAFLVQAWFRDPETTYALNGVSWTLSCEAFFYAVFPFLAPQVLRFSPRAVLGGLVALTWLTVIAVAVVLPRQSDGWLLLNNPTFRVLEFAIGIALARYVQEGRRPPLSLSQAAWLVVGVFVGVSVGASLAEDAGLGRLTLGFAGAIVLVPLMALIAAAAHSDLGGSRTWLHRPVLVRLGQWSFALYLVHELVLRAFRPLTEDLAWPVAVLAAVVLVGFAQLVAAVLHQGFEAPVERRLREAGKVPTPLDGRT